jgi:hypothetical protein
MEEFIMVNGKQAWHMGEELKRIQTEVSGTMDHGMPTNQLHSESRWTYEIYNATNDKLSSVTTAESLPRSQKAARCR